MTESQLYDRPLPANLDCERFILGSILINGECFDKVAAILDPADFLLEKHKRIFHRMTEIAHSGERIDRVTLANALMNAGQLESVDGFAYLVSLDQDLPRIENIESYIRIVQDKSTKRRAIFAYQQAIDELMLDAEDAPELLEKSEHMISALRADRKDGGFKTPMQVIDEAGGVDAFLSPRTLAGIPTPWHGLNLMLTGGGFSPGQLVVVGGRPGAGKTGIAANVAVGCVQKWLRCAYVSLEMTSADMLRRMICSRASVNLKKLSHMESAPMEREYIAEALDELAAPDHPGLLMWKNQTASVLALRAELRREAAKAPIAMVVVDYLQLMESISGKRDQNRNNEISEMSRGLKLLAMELKCVVIVLSQLSRDSEKQERRPKLSDLRDSGAIEADADIVLFPYTQPVEVLPDVVDYELIIAKQRNGPVGMVSLAFTRRFVRFDER